MNEIMLNGHSTQINKRAGTGQNGIIASAYSHSFYIYTQLLSGFKSLNFWPGPSSVYLICACKQWMLWRDCAFAQARLSLRCSHMRYLQKSHELAQIQFIGQYGYLYWSVCDMILNDLIARNPNFAACGQQRRRAQSDQRLCLWPTKNMKAHLASSNISITKLISVVEKIR